MKNRKFICVLMLSCSVTTMTKADNEQLDCQGERAIVCGNGCGDNCYWEISDNGTLTISGQGDMYDSLYDESPWYTYRDSVEEVYVNHGITSVSDGAFYELPKLAYAEISDTVTSIGSEAFVGTTLGSIEIGSNVEYIGGEAFRGLQYLNYISLPNSLTEIGDGAFLDAPLQNLTIPDSVTYIADNAFDGSVVNDLVCSAENLQRYLDASGVFDVGDINLSCTIGDCKKILEAWDTANGTSYATRAIISTTNTDESSTQVSQDVVNGGESTDGTENTIKTPSAPERADIRIYTIDEANQVAGKVNSVKIRYR